MAYDNIMSSDDVVEAKRYSHTIQNVYKNAWNQVKRGIMKTILRSNFQNEKLRDELLNSVGKTIHEAGQLTSQLMTKTF